MRKQYTSHRAFTLLELIAVLVILVALFAIIGLTLQNRILQARTDSTKLQIGNFEQSLQRYQLSRGGFPTTEQGLNALIYIPANEGMQMQGQGMMPGGMQGTPGVDPTGMMGMGGGMNTGATGLSTDSMGMGGGMPGTDPTGMMGAPGAGGMGGLPGTDPTGMMGAPGAGGMGGLPGTDPTGMMGAPGAGGMGGLPGTDPTGMAGGGLGTAGAALPGGQTTQPFFNPQLYTVLRKRPIPFYDQDDIPNDPWGSPYRYEYAPYMGINPRTGENRPAIWSAGPDGTDNTEDDIRNWDPVKVAQLQAARQQQLGAGGGMGTDPTGMNPIGMNPNDPMGMMNQMGTGQPDAFGQPIGGGQPGGFGQPIGGGQPDAFTPPGGGMGGGMPQTPPGGGGMGQPPITPGPTPFAPTP